MWLSLNKTVYYGRLSVNFFFVLVGWCEKIFRQRFTHFVSVLNDKMTKMKEMKKMCKHMAIYSNNVMNYECHKK